MTQSVGVDWGKFGLCLRKSGRILNGGPNWEMYDNFADPIDKINSWGLHWESVHS